jgi:hypothetical protein
MSSGQPKATSKNIAVGRYVMLDQYPYKPFKITTILQPEQMLWLSNPTPHIRATRAMSFDEFDKAGYVFAEADAQQEDSKDE